jgi:hypothetical protein
VRKRWQRLSQSSTLEKTSQMLLSLLGERKSIWTLLKRKWHNLWKSGISNIPHDLDFYFAGVLSKSEEQMFWEVIQTNKISAAEKKRLLTFFYKEQFTNIIEKQKS